MAQDEKFDLEALARESSVRGGQPLTPERRPASLASAKDESFSKTNSFDERQPPSIERGQSLSSSENAEMSTQPTPRQDRPAIERVTSVTSSASAAGNHDYPEGGLRAWLVVLGGLAGMTASFGMMNSIGIFQAYVSQNQLKDYSEGTIGWIFSLYVFLSFFCGIQIGPIFDQRGPRLLVFTGSVLLVCSMMLLGICTAYWHFLVVFGIIGGTGTSLIFTPSVASVGHFFFKRRANATGIAAVGGSLGGIIFPLMAQSLFPQVGFAWTTRIMAFMFIGLLAIANLLIRSRLPPQPGGSALPDFRIFSDLKFALTTAGVFFIEFGLFIPIGYLTTYALAQGIPSAFSYQLLAIFNAGSVFGRWLPGYVADRIGRFNTMIMTILLCLVMVFALWLPAGGSIPMIVIYSVLFGFGSGSGISLTPVCVGQQCKTENYGRYYATCYTIVSVGTLTGIPIAGQILARNNGEYWGLIVFTGACYSAALIAFMAVRILAVGWKFKAIY
ncbi:MAG: Histidine kinase [Chaenotheca gracillima]|nr:MAG: Histidine kinase [Chaenotheca gracillima]